MFDLIKRGNSHPSFYPSCLSLLYDAKEDSPFPEKSSSLESVRGIKKHSKFPFLYPPPPPKEQLCAPRTKSVISLPQPSMCIRTNKVLKPHVTSTGNAHSQNCTSRTVEHMHRLICPLLHGFGNMLSCHLGP